MVMLQWTRLFWEWPTAQRMSNKEFEFMWEFFPHNSVTEILSTVWKTLCDEMAGSGESAMCCRLAAASLKTAAQLLISQLRQLECTAHNTRIRIVYFPDDFLTYLPQQAVPSYLLHLKTSSWLYRSCAALAYFSGQGETSTGPFRSCAALLDI